MDRIKSHVCLRKPLIDLKRSSTDLKRPFMYQNKNYRNLKGPLMEALDIWSHMDLNSPLIDLIMSHMDLKKAPYGPEEVTYGHRKVTSFEH